jgi:Tol biopolymer transport system component
MPLWNARSMVPRRLLAGSLGLLVPVLAGAQPTTTRVSVATDGTQGNNYSGRVVVSADGRWVAFTSAADNLVPGDTNFQWDVFLHDRQTGTTTRVSMAPGGGQMDIPSDFPAISADGRWVAFQSGSPLGTTQVFLHDRETGTTTPVSVGLGGIAGSGAFPAMSADGNWVSFTSRADNLVAGDTNGVEDVFVYDRQTAVVTRVSVGSGGAQGNRYSWSLGSLSADGRSVAFASMASNLVADDTNEDWDVFVHDRQTGTTTRVSVGPGGAQGNGGSFNAAISADGRWVAFASRASNLLPGDTNGHEDVFVHDRQTGATTGVSVGLGSVPGNADSSRPAISADGRSVAFYSAASNLVAGDTNGSSDVFVRDRHAGVTTRVSVGPGGVQGAGSSVGASISADGRVVAFESEAGNLAADDTNFQWDAFAHDRGDTGCGVTLVPSSVSVLAAAATGHLLVLGSAGCAWTALSNAPDWLTVTDGTSGTGFGGVDYGVEANAGDARTGVITIAGSAFTANQADPLSPAAPIGLVARAVVGNLVTLRWTMPPAEPPPTGFVLEGGVHPGEVLASIPTGSASPTFTFTAPAGSFYARVVAMNGTTRSAASNEIRLHVSQRSSTVYVDTRMLRSPTTVSATHIAFAVRQQHLGGRAGGRHCAARSRASRARPRQPANNICSRPTARLDRVQRRLRRQHRRLRRALRGRRADAADLAPGRDQVQGWTPDGTRVLFASGRATWAPNAAPRFWTVPAAGGVEEPMALPRGYQGKISPDGRAHRLPHEQLVGRGAAQLPRRAEPARLDRRPQDLRPRLAAVDRLQGHGPGVARRHVYFISDRDGVANVWSYDTKRRRWRR